MKTLSIFILLLVVFVSALVAQDSSALARSGNLPLDSLIIIPGKRVGPITKQATEEALVEMFGAELVQSVMIPVGEGMSIRGTVVFPGIPEKTISILWQDEVNKRYPDVVIISNEGTQWKTNRGITIGTTSKELEKLNGNPFRMTGFGWDYAGTVLDCNEGELKEVGFYDPENMGSGLQGRSLLLRLGPDPMPGKEISMEEYEEIVGDKELFSSHAVIRKLNLKVLELRVEFNDK